MDGLDSWISLYCITPSSNKFIFNFLLLVNGAKFITEGIDINVRRSLNYDQNDIAMLLKDLLIYFYEYELNHTLHWNKPINSFPVLVQWAVSTSKSGSRKWKHIFDQKSGYKNWLEQRRLTEITHFDLEGYVGTVTTIVSN